MHLWASAGEVLDAGALDHERPADDCPGQAPGPKELSDVATAHAKQRCGVFDIQEQRLRFRLGVTYWALLVNARNLSSRSNCFRAFRLRSVRGTLISCCGL